MSIAVLASLTRVSPVVTTPKDVNHSRFDTRCHATKALRPCCLRAVKKGQ
jgi:hypothetical protein